VAPRVAVYTHKAPRQLRKALSGTHIHRANALHLVGMDRELIARWTQRLTRRSEIALSVSGARVYLASGHETTEGNLNTLVLTN